MLPINAMGMSKSLMEKTLLSKARDKKNKTVFSIVRYGNVIYSRGSVIPLFSRQIIDGKDILRNAWCRLRRWMQKDVLREWYQ